jgi:hypothetical protein
MGSGVSREDIEAAYRLILGRAPESEDAISIHESHPDLDSLRRAFLASEEFQSKFKSPTVPDALAIESASFPSINIGASTSSEAPALTSELALVFLHLPKTGGSTLHELFSAHFAPEEICPQRHSNLRAYSVDELRQWRFFSGHFDADEIRRIPRPLFVVTVLRDPIERLLSLYYFWKRHTDEFINKFSADFLRMTKDGTLLDFLRNSHPMILHAAHNAMVRQLAGAVKTTASGYGLMKSGETAESVTEAQLMSLALKNLLSFDVVGNTSELSLVYERVASVFGMKSYPSIPKINTREDVDEHVGPVTPEPITPEIQALLEEKTRLDRMLYQLASNHAGLKMDQAKGKKRRYKKSAQH